MKRIWAGLFAGILLFTGPAWAKTPIRLAVQPTATAEELSGKAEDLELFLEQATGEDVELFFPTSYAGVVEALRFGHADAAFMSAWPAVLAREKAGAEVVLAEIREVLADGQKTEAPSYESYWVVLPDSPARSLEDLRGMRAAFPSPMSTSGYVAPVAKLVERGLLTPSGQPADPKMFFREVHFSGGYAQAWEALKNGQADVTVVAGDVAEKLYHEVLAATRVVDRQGPIPSHAVVFAKGFEGPAREKLLASLLELGKPEHRELMRKFVSGIFVRFEKADGSHLAALESMLGRAQLEYTEKKK